MNNDAIVISNTLDRVVERAGDPAGLVFKRLFAAYPRAEALFVRDTSGLVRGQRARVARSAWTRRDGAVATPPLSRDAR